MSWRKWLGLPYPTNKYTLIAAYDSTTESYLYILYRQWVRKEHDTDPMFKIFRTTDNEMLAKCWSHDFKAGMIYSTKVGEEI